MLIIIVGVLSISFMIGMVAWGDLKTYLTDNEVSWYKPKYHIMPYKVNIQYNFFGDVKSYDEVYVICKHLPYVYTKYFYCNEYNYCTKQWKERMSKKQTHIIQWMLNITSASKFMSHDDAYNLLTDMLKNPNNYILEK